MGDVNFYLLDHGDLYLAKDKCILFPLSQVKIIILMFDLGGINTSFLLIKNTI